MKQRNLGHLTDVPGFLLGHAQEEAWGTGVSVILAPAGSIGGVDVRGGAPGTRETDLLRPENAVSQVDAVVLSGGSAFGLEAACGVMKGLRAAGRGLETGYGRVPIVSSAVLYDLGVGESGRWPTMEMGLQALKDASDSAPAQGNVGAGLGCTVGKLFGMAQAMKSGLGQASLQSGDLVVSCVVAVNAVGDVMDPTKPETHLAGLLDDQGRRASSWKAFCQQGENQPSLLGKNTTIACLATNARLDKAGTTKVCQMGQDGLARAIVPVHTLFDGDSLFCLASGQVEAEPNLVGILGAAVVQEAIYNAILFAEPAYGLMSYQSL